MGEFTASNIAMDMDEKEKAKGSIVDMAKLTADIAAQKEIAAKASPRLGLLGSWTDINSICKCVRAWVAYCKYSTWCRASRSARGMHSSDVFQFTQCRGNELKPLRGC